MVVNPLLVGREALLVVMGPHDNAMLGGARPHHGAADVPETRKPVIHESLA